jgi:hypothetical protein
MTAVHVHMDRTVRMLNALTSVLLIRLRILLLLLCAAPEDIPVLLNQAE